MQKLKSDDITKIYGHMNKDLLKALGLSPDWIIKRIGPLTLSDWTKIKMDLGNHYKMLSYNVNPKEEDNFNNINIAVSPIGDRILKDRENVT